MKNDEVIDVSSVLVIFKIKVELSELKNVV